MRVAGLILTLDMGFLTLRVNKCLRFQNFLLNITEAHENTSAIILLKIQFLAEFHLICMSQRMGFRFLSHMREAKAEASLRICADSPEPSLLACTKYEHR